ncbi:hypothetical protein FBU59_007010, partial [Linderina macrospora]
PALTFAPSTRFSPPPITRRRTASSHDSEDQVSDPDDLVASQTDLAREQLKRDVVGPGLEKEKEVKCGFLAKRAGGAGKVRTIGRLSAAQRSRQRTRMGERVVSC